MTAITVNPRVTPTDVRAWAASEGIEVSQRGRLSVEVINAFNKGRKGKDRYVTAPRAALVKVTAVRTTNGRKTPITKHVNVTELRDKLVAAGLRKPGTRGRLPESTLKAFVSGELDLPQSN